MGIINIFKRGTQQLNSGMDTWMVKWHCFESRISIADIVPRYQAFANKDEAEEFADSIRRAHKLIGNSGNTSVSVTKQKNGL